MDSKETINLFDHRRHDQMNDLQLLLSYTAMGKIDRVEKILREKVNEANQERKLSNLNIPETALWVMSFNWNHDDIRLAYEIKLEKTDLSAYDDQIKRTSQRVIETIRLFFVPFYLYQLSFFIESPAKEKAVAEVKLIIKGEFQSIEHLEEQLKQISELEKVILTEEGKENTICTVSWNCK